MLLAAVRHVAGDLRLVGVVACGGGQAVERARLVRAALLLLGLTLTLTLALTLTLTLTLALTRNPNP